LKLAGFLPSIGEPIVRSGKNYKWTGAGNDSVYIIPHNPHLYKHFATEEAGNAITFCTSKLGMTFVDAVVALNRGRFLSTFPKREGAKELYNTLQNAKNGADKPFVLPKADKDCVCPPKIVAVGHENL